MKQINGLAIIFLLAFAVSVFVFISKLFSEEEDKSTSGYRIEVKEIKNDEYRRNYSNKRQADS